VIRPKAACPFPDPRTGRLGCIRWVGLRLGISRLTVCRSCPNGPAFGLDQMGTRRPRPRFALEIHDIARAIGLLPLASPAPEAEHPRGVFVGTLAAETSKPRIDLDQNRRQGNWLAARHAAHTAVGLLDSVVHYKISSGFFASLRVADNTSVGTPSLHQLLLAVPTGTCELHPAWGILRRLKNSSSLNRSGFDICKLQITDR